MVLFNVDPFTTSTIGFVFFYASLLLALTGTIALFMLLYYYHFARAFVPMYRYVKKSFLVSAFSSLIVTVLLMLQGKGFLNLWTFAVLVTMSIVFGLLTRSLHASSRH